MIYKDYGETSVSATKDMDYLLKNGSTYILGVKKIEEYIDTYAKVDVILELKAARQWLIDNPTKRKTSRGMGKYLNGWLLRAQERQINSFSKPKAKGFADVSF